MKSKDTGSTHVHLSDTIELKSAWVVNNIFTERMVEYWNRLPRKAMESPSLETVKTWLESSHGQPAVDDPALNRGVGLDGL